MDWNKQPAARRIQLVHVDFMSHPEFALLSGVTMVGRVKIDPKCPTAGTDGRDVFYGEAFVMGHNRKQIRYLVAHENFHKALKHVSEYRHLWDKYGMVVNMAMDYVINLMIEDMDAGKGWVERPTIVPPLIDPKYRGMSFMQVLRDLLKNPPPQSGGNGKGKGKGTPGNGSGDPQSFDEHDYGGGEEMTEAEAKELGRQIDDAVRQGVLVRERMAGNGKGGADVSALTQVRDTNWKQYLREFFETVCAGDDNSRFVPPNKRMLASGFLMPSHFSESTGEIGVFCDTSGSMTHVYPVVFGEIARICENARPESVRVIWWDTAVCGEQLFTPADYDKIPSMLQPKGGGGTTPECVKQYIEDKGYKFKAGVWLSDGDFYTSDVVLNCPVLWGIVDNDRFVPQQGRVVRITGIG